MIIDDDWLSINFAHDAQSPIAMSEFQTNIPFPFNSRLPLVRYSFPPVFPTMSPQESRILWCLLEGDTKPYDIFDIPIVANVSRLKEAIQQRVKALRGVDADSLKLWKVVSLNSRGMHPLTFSFRSM
jgi:hypothetical protein